MSHLEEQISALIDGELTGADLDRANAHLAACERCRTEAAALRQLKRQLRSLATPPFEVTVGTDSPAAAAQWAAGERAATADEALTRRLLAMAGPGGPVPSRRFRREQFRRARREHRGKREPGTRGGAGDRGGPAGRRPRSDWPPYDRRPPRVLRLRGRYLVWSALSLAVVGIVAAAFSMGGGGPQPGPKVTPQLEMFSLEHAAQTGDFPLPDLTQAPTARP